MKAGPREFMGRAVRSALAGIRRGDGGPFGAAIVREGRVIAVARNTVLRSQDPTCHAEVKAIRAASRKLRRFDLSGCDIYSTTEPCPMCFAAIHWARIGRLVYGTRIGDVLRRGFNELSIPAARMKSLGKSCMRIEAGFMQPECEKLLAEWDRLPHREVY